MKPISQLWMRWKCRKLYKLKDMPTWAQAALFVSSGLISSYWGMVVGDVGPGLTRYTNGHPIALPVALAWIVLATIALQTVFFTGMALQCGKYLQEKIFE